jgi:hypothetical protein
MIDRYTTKAAPSVGISQVRIAWCGDRAFFILGHGARWNCHGLKQPTPKRGSRNCPEVDMGKMRSHGDPENAGKDGKPVAEGVHDAYEAKLPSCGLYRYGIDIFLSTSMAATTGLVLR